MRAYWSAFWFAPSPPTNLAVCRILLFGGLFLVYFRTDFSAWGDVSDAFWMPIWLFDRLGLAQPRRDVVAVLQTLWKVSLAFSSLGLLTRASTAVAFPLGGYLLGLPHNFGGLHHSDAIVVLVLGVMALSRCGDRWTFDALFRRRHDAAGPRPEPHPEYTWPIRAAWVAIALVYFAAGVAKVRYGGFEWIASDNLALRLVQSHYGLSNTPPLTSWGLHVARYPAVCQALAAVTVAAELGYPFALVDRRMRLLIVPTLFLVQIGIRLMMGPSFAPLLIAHVFWVPWAAAAAGVVGRWAGRRDVAWHPPQC